jgi:nitrogen fixation NifU-like protein
MSDLRDLYQEVILDHSKNPRQSGRLDPAQLSADGHNPLCGDKLYLTVNLDGDRVGDIRFEGNGCAISTASASMMCQALKGASLAEVGEKFEAFHKLVTGEAKYEIGDPPLGKLAIFAGVSKFPVRVKCATLAWHTLRAALDGMKQPISTEGGDDMAAPAKLDPKELESSVVDVLKTCYDPEIPVDIYELGLIYSVKASDEGHVDIQMTLTSPACPVAGTLPGEVEAKVRALPEVSSAQVELVWDPPWDKEMMSEAAQVKLGFF